MFGRRKPDPVRHEASVKIAEASGDLLRLWQLLAEAGRPRLRKAARAQAIADATDRFDRARTAAADAGRKIATLQIRVEGSREQKADLFIGGEPEPHDRAAVTQLVPQLRGLRSQLEHARVCLLAYYDGAPIRRSYDGLEATAARRRSMCFFDKPVPARCSWCGVSEEFGVHVPLDGYGLLVDRKEARRLCCQPCFLNGSDLSVPQPIDQHDKPAQGSTPEGDEPQREDSSPRAEMKSGPTLGARAAAV